MTRALAVVALAPQLAAAHAVEETSSRWTLDPWIVVPLALAALLFALGSARIARRSSAPALRRRRALWFCLGWTTLAGALVSPLHAAGERSFAAHMLEHELLMLVAAPLLVLSRPLGAFAWALPPALRRASGRVEKQRAFAAVWAFLTEPVAATVLQAVALWAWHAPGPFGRALESSGWHVAQHLSFFATALFFWTAVLDERTLAARPVRAVACLFATALVGGALGALMAFSWSPWYAGYAALGLTPLGLTPVEDQQLAGLLMWIPGGIVHAGAALAIVFGVLRAAHAPAKPG